MQNNPLHTVFLADDDPDDRYLFEEAFYAVAQHDSLVMANDGSELMRMLKLTVPPPPKVIFLDLNMPLKNGFQCLSEIRKNETFKDIPVVIFSTSTEPKYIDQVFEDGANYYLCKPNSFPKLKSAITQVLSINWAEQPVNRVRDEFVLDC